jgi:hypothetical protein
LVVFSQWDRLDKQRLASSHGTSNNSLVKDSSQPTTNAGFPQFQSISILLSQTHHFSSKTSVPFNKSQSVTEEKKIALQIRMLSCKIFHHFQRMIQEAMPIDPHNGMQKGLTFWEHFLRPMFNFHDYAVMFGKVSMSNTRVLRWTNLNLQLFFAFFLDTLFFGLFYVDKGQCELFTTESECLASRNAFTLQTTCLWSGSTEVTSGTRVESTSCTLNPPPEDLIFSVILSAVTLLIAVPFSMLFDRLLFGICSQRPDFTKWNFFGWLQTSSLQKKLPNRHQVARNEIVDLAMATACESLLLLSADEIRDITSCSYWEASSAEAEVWELRRRVSNASNAAKPVQEAMDTSQRVLLRRLRNQVNYARIRSVAIESMITATDMVTLPNEELTVLPARDKIKHGGNESEINKLKCQSQWSSLLSDVNNKTLLQFFILDQMPMFERFALQFQCFDDPLMSPGNIHPLIWITAWSTVIGASVFFLYWVVAWTATSGSAAFKAWGINFAISLVQDVLLIQFFRVFFLFIATQFAILPRLDVIQTVLQEVAAMISLETAWHVVQTADGSSNKLFHVNTLKSSGKIKSQKGNTPELPLIQHLAAACRISHRKDLIPLPAAKILRRLDDSHAFRCQQRSLFRKPPKMGFLAWLLLLAPAVLMHWNESMAVYVFDTVFPTLAVSLFVGFCFLFLNSLPLFITLLVFVAVSALFRTRKQVRKFGKKYDYQQSIDLDSLQHDTHNKSLFPLLSRYIYPSYVQLKFACVRALDVLLAFPSRFMIPSNTVILSEPKSAFGLASEYLYSLKESQLFPRDGVDQTWYKMNLRWNCYESKQMSSRILKKNPSIAMPSTLQQLLKDPKNKFPPLLGVQTRSSSVKIDPVVVITETSTKPSHKHIYKLVIKPMNPSPTSKDLIVLISSSKPPADRCKIYRFHHQVFDSLPKAIERTMKLLLERMDLLSEAEKHECFHHKKRNSSKTKKKKQQHHHEKEDSEIKSEAPWFAYLPHRSRQYVKELSVSKAKAEANTNTNANANATKSKKKDHKKKKSELEKIWKYCKDSKLSKSLSTFLVQKLFTIYHPGGFALNEMERLEVEELLEQWLIVHSSKLIHYESEDYVVLIDELLIWIFEMDCQVMRWRS